MTGILRQYVETGEWPKPDKPGWYKRPDHPKELIGEPLLGPFETKAIMDKAPSIEQLAEWEGGCEATDGCWVEPDGICEHGCKSWLLELGMI